MKKNNILEESVRLSLEQYFSDLGDTDPSDMYEMVIRCVERPILEVAMERANQNQSKAAQMLGMTRNTLRKKLIFHKLIPQD
ncbi:helix-turn-helix domain-containing protein [Zwartia panacis]|uniref:helix-turn-helix domain-containing protein n=1 Tax=Zwartia panacis TaxID=2683345 RepID=UPI0025B56CF7|nr:helix-turn-helix domain-containing protein [Zwartia panacis]MDN4016002.1 helix-turn-helix domain-containing protein [Zwartia panacis]